MNGFVVATYVIAAVVLTGTAVLTMRRTRVLRRRLDAPRGGPPS